MDGVLVDSEDAMTRTAIESLERFGVHPARKDFLEFTGMGEDRFIGGVAQKYGLAYRTEMKDYAYGLYIKKAKTLVRVYEGVRETLEKLKARGYRMAVASAADLVKVGANLGCIGIGEDFFDAVVTGSDVKRKKPDPEIFLTAAEKLRAEPARCIVTEDALSGIQAAKAAGMSAFAVTTSFDRKSLGAAGADDVMDDIREIVAVLEQRAAETRK